MFDSVCVPRDTQTPLFVTVFLDQRGLYRLEEPGVSGFLGVLIDRELIKKRSKSLLPPPATTALFGA